MELGADIIVDMIGVCKGEMFVMELNADVVVDVWDNVVSVADGTIDEF